MVELEHCITIKVNFYVQFPKHVFDRFTPVFFLNFNSGLTMDQELSEKYSFS